MPKAREILNREDVLNHMLIPLGAWHILPCSVKLAINWATDGYGPYTGPTGKSIAVGHNKNMGYFILTRNKEDQDKAEIIWNSGQDAPFIPTRNRWENG